MGEPPLTESESREWFSLRYSNRLSLVLPLSTGRLVVANLYREAIAVVANSDELLTRLQTQAVQPEPEYKPPTPQLELPLSLTDLTLEI